MDSVIISRGILDGTRRLAPGGYSRDLALPFVSVFPPNNAYASDVILFLCGGSPTVSKEVFFQSGLMEWFARCGFGTVAFDYRGIGESRVPFCKTGLHTRVEDAERMMVFIHHEWGVGGITPFGISMGGYVAVKLISSMLVDKMVLIAPAAYDRRAYNGKVYFGDTFSRVLRRRDSWQDSDLFELLRDHPYKPIFMFTFAEDVVVPSYITDKIARVARFRRNAFRHTCLPYRGHHGTCAITLDGLSRREAIFQEVEPWLKSYVSSKPSIAA